VRNQPEAFTSDLGDDQSRCLFVVFSSCGEVGQWYVGLVHWLW